ncbi:GATOR complex protein WDR24 [Tribolium madens]|uniref:GATOR complex protein WDR24 n=1 Tax=Tribolium madens TaxID=41895 RepID=UPI001CF7511F|nr:GATOR complex protein WDR24 [Tribolium madens]
MATFHVLQEGPVNALALNRDNTQVAIGGRNVFKVYTIEEDKFREVCNLRASKHLNLSFSCNDVSWSWTDDHYLATAATNGHVCVWNLTKMGKAMQEQDYQEHKRTVNKVNFHASEPNRLISGSQDGTMRYFDIRVKNAVAIFYSNTESVRDVQFSPHNPYTFAAVSENGSVQLWDVRRSDKCQQQFAAHSGPIFACDWHPENTWLATASRDKTIKVWDLTSKLTLEYTIHTIASIGHVKWRPQRRFHIASCALVVDCSINIWDVRRPYIPYAAFNEHKDTPSGVAWKEDPHVFLSSGRDSTLYQHSFDYASRPAKKANPQGVSLNNRGEILYAHKTNVSTLVKAPVGIIRKTSTTQSPDLFHLASSLMHQFTLSNENKCESEIFIGLAKNYILSGRSLSEMCEHNSAVANKYGKNQISVVWKIMKTMYGEEYLQTSSNNNNREDIISHNNMGLDHSNENDQRSRGGDTPAAQFSDETENEDQVDHIAIYNNGFPTYLNIRTGLPKGDFSFGENELDMELDGIMTDFQSGYRNFVTPQQDFVLPNEAFHIRHEIRNRSPPPDKFPNNFPPVMSDDQNIPFEEQPNNLLTVSCLPKMPLWDPSSIVLDALKHHAMLGDVQTAACVLIVLGDQRKCLNDLDESTQEHWLLGYIELLSRFQLWNIATQIIKLSWIPAVEQLNQQSTRFNTNCSKCSKALQRIGWLCDRCHSSQYASCSVCHQVVKGLYAWCQGCSHGGHLLHMKQWFAVNKMCPTGCRHLCEYK